MGMDGYQRDFYEREQARAKRRRRNPDGINPTLAKIYEDRRRKDGLNRQDIEIAYRANNFGVKDTERFELELRRRGAQSLMMDAAKVPELERKTWIRENCPDYAFKGGDPKDHKPPSVRQSVRHAYHTAAVKQALREGYGITDPGTRERDYWNGFAGQVIEKVRDGADRRLVGDVMENAMSGRMHPQNVRELADSVQIEQALELGRGLRDRGFIRDPEPPRKLGLRQVIKAALRMHAPTLTSMNGRIQRVPD